MRKALIFAAILALVPTASVAHEPGVCSEGIHISADVRIDAYDNDDLTGQIGGTRCFNGNANGGSGETWTLSTTNDDRIESTAVRYISSQGNGAMSVLWIDTDPSPDVVLTTMCIDDNPNHIHVYHSAGNDNRTDRIIVWSAGSANC
jgi:hypothetical protein